MYDKALDPHASKQRASIRLVLSAHARALHGLPVLMKAAFIKNPIKRQVPSYQHCKYYPLQMPQEPPVQAAGLVQVLA